MSNNDFAPLCSLVFMSSSVATTPAQVSGTEEFCGALGQCAEDPANVSGSYRLLRTTWREWLGDPALPEWVVNCRMAVEVEEMPNRCEHGKLITTCAFDCFHPKLQEEVDLAAYSSVRHWQRTLGSRRVALCIRCGLCPKVLESIRVSQTVSLNLLVEEERYNRWCQLSEEYQVMFPVHFTSAFVQDVHWCATGAPVPYPLKETTRSRSEHLASPTAWRKTKRNPLPPHEFHALFAIFWWLHELLCQCYSGIFPEKSHPATKGFAAYQAVRIQPNEHGQAAPLRAALSEDCGVVASQRDFIAALLERLRHVTASTGGKHIFGFRDLMLGDVDLERLCVRVAHIAVDLLPRVRMRRLVAEIL